MPKIILEKKHFLMGLASGYYNQDGLFRQSISKGIDVFRSKATYGLLQQGYKYINITSSGTTTIVADTIKFFVQKDEDCYGYGNNGYLYKFTNGTTPSKLDAGNEGLRTGGKGLTIYHDGTSDKLHYFASTTIGTYDFASTFNNSYKTGLESAPHPAKEWQGILYFGNGRYVGSLNGTTAVTAALTLPVGYEVQDIDIYDNYLAILTHKATGALNTECKLFLWNGYTTDEWQYEYVVPEKAYSLEKYKDGLAIFGYNIRLFRVSGYENFDVIHNIESTTVYPGQTAYNNNTVFWQENGFLGSFGSPDSRIEPSVQAPLKDTGEKGAIINIGIAGNQFLISRNDNTCYLYNSGYSEGTVQSIRIDLPVPSKIKGVTLVFEKLASGDGFGFLLYDDSGLILSQVNTTYATHGAKTTKYYPVNSKLSNFVYFTIDWGNALAGGNAIVKKIIIEYEPTELKES